MKMSKIVAGVLAVACICSTFGVGAYDRNILKDLTSVTMTAKAYEPHSKVYAELGEAGFIYYINDTQRVTIEGYGKVRLDENGEPVYEYGELVIDPVTPPENLVIPERFFISEYPDGIEVQEIGEGAFEGCSNIVSLELSDSVTQISGGAFKHTALTEVTIPYRVKVIGGEAFAISTLKTVEFEDNGLYKNKKEEWEEKGEWETKPRYANASELKEMGNCVFAGSRITSVRVPKSVTAVIGNYFDAPFEGANYLTEVNFAKDALVIPERICMNCYALKHIDIPPTVATIGAGAFCDSGLEEVSIPANVETIGERAFGVDQWWSLGKGQTDSEELIASFPFLKEGYLPLSKVTLHEGVTFIGNCAFAGSQITDITIPASVTDTTIGDSNGGILTDCHFLENVTISEGMKRIPERFLLHCGSKKLNVVKIPDTVETIGDSAFSNTYLKELTIPASVTTIEGHAFYNTLLTEVDIPSNVKVVGNRAFAHDTALVRTTEGTRFFGPLAKVTLHEGLEFLGQNVFEGSVITSIVIPSTLKEVYGNIYGWGPFDGIDKFDTVWTESNFTDNMSLRDLKLFIVTDYPSVYADEGESTNLLGSEPSPTLKELNVEDYVNLDVTLAEGTTEIPDNLFNHCSSLKSIIIPDTVEKIGNSAFHNTYLSEVDVPASVKEIGEDAFGFDVRQETLNGQEAEFRSPLTKVTLHEGLETIRGGAFKGTSITDIYIPSTLQEGAGAFQGMERPELDEAFETIKDDDGNIIDFVRDKDGNIIDSVRDKDGSIIHFVTDKDGNIIDFVRDKDGNIIHFVTDKDGNIVEKIKFYIPSDEPDGSAFPNSYQKISAEDYISTYSELHATLGEGMETIPSHLFEECKILKEVDVPATVSKVGDGAFGGTSIKEFTLSPSKGTSIGDGAFGDCTALKKVTINDPCCDIWGGAIPETATIASYHFTDDPADFTTTENYAKSNNNDFESLGDMLFFGDVNDDGAVNLKDVVTIRRYIAYEGDEPREEAVPLNTQRADINQDGTINLKDVVLARRLAASITKN